MTISSEIRKAGPFLGNGVATSFPFTFKIFDKTDLRVVRTMPEGFESDLVLDSDYSVILNNDQDASPGGTILYPISGSPLATGEKLTAIGNLSALQPMDLQNQSGFYPQVIENSADRQTMLIQQMAEQASRALVVAVSDTTGVELPAAALRASKYLAFDAQGNPITVDGSAQVGDAQMVNFTPAGTGAVARTAQDKMRDVVSVTDFFANGVSGAPVDRTGVIDSTLGLQAARDFVAANATRYKLVFPSGIYKYSVSPNWAIQDAVIEAEGQVRLRYTGTGNAVIIDSGGSGLTYNLQMGRFIVEAPASALNGVFVRSVHHSRLGFNVRGAGSASSGLLVSFAVCTHFDNYICSVNEEGWYLGARPAAGMTLQVRNPGETVSYCTFTNPIVEGPPIGIQLLGTLGNIFHGGTSEGCPDYGVFSASSALYDRFYGTDFEANGISDIYALGTGLEFLNCDTFTSVNFGPSSTRCVLSGGGHENILSDAGSTANTFKDLNYNRLGTGGSFTDAGTGTEVLNVRNGGVVGSPMLLTGSVAFSAATLNPGDASVSTVTVPGAKLGDFALASGTMSLINLTVTAVVTAAGIVTVYAVNNISGAPVSIGAGTIKVRLFRGV